MSGKSIPIVGNYNMLNQPIKEFKPLDGGNTVKKFNRQKQVAAAGTIAAAGTGIALLAKPKEAMAIDAAAVQAAMDGITTAAGATADVALPIAAGIISFGIIATVLMKFMYKA